MTGSKKRQPIDATPAPIYHLKVSLKGVAPLIWRRLQVPGNANLGWLHAVIQVAMGWTNSHLHQFV
ncbi:MAG: plasmid pRiA4b ORF-3 family protein, partial [candidate division NC10 bacterium]